MTQQQHKNVYVLNQEWVVAQCSGSTKLIEH